MSKPLPADSPEALSRFHEHLDLVDLIARQVSRSFDRVIQFDELLSAGREGLLDAARRYDASRSASFRSYANYRIHGAMIDAVRAQSFLPRRAHERLAALEATNRAAEGGLAATFSDPGMTDGEAEAALEAEQALAATAYAMSTIARSGQLDQLVAVDGETPEEQFARAELIAYLQQAIGNLKEAREAEVVRLHLEGKTVEAIGRELVMSKPWVSRLIRRATDRLAKQMRAFV